MDRSFRKIFIAVFFICLSVSAGNNEELFLSANKLYNEYEYDKALELYDMITQKGRAVLYNMGNCYYHKNNYAYALLYWERAKVNAKFNEIGWINNNKKHVLQKLNKTDTGLGCAKLFDGVSFVLSYVSVLFLQCLFLILWYLLLYVMVRRHSFKLLLASLCLFFMIIIGAFLWIYYVDASQSKAIVVKGNTQLLSGPYKEFHLLQLLPEADYVIVKEKRERWYKVKYSGKIGWVDADSVRCI